MDKVNLIDELNRIKKMTISADMSDETALCEIHDQLFYLIARVHKEVEFKYNSLMENKGDLDEENN